MNIVRSWPASPKSVAVNSESEITRQAGGTSQVRKLSPSLSSGDSVPLRILLFAVALFAIRLDAQDWTPVHIVGMPYVAEARDARISGVVRLRCALNSDGSVEDIEVLSGHKVFLKAVLENARQWRFAIGDKPNASARKALLIYEFKLTYPVCGGRYREQFVLDQPDRVLVTSEFPCPEPNSATN
jgi:TonB family protein